MHPNITLKSMAEGGYVMGLSTIGEVATHMDLHYDVYFQIENFAEEMRQFGELVRGHEDESIDQYLTTEDKKRMDDELDAAMAESPLPKVDADGF